MKRNKKEMKGNESKNKEKQKARNTESQMKTIAMFRGDRSSGSGGPIALHRKMQTLGSDGNLHKGPFIPSFDPCSNELLPAFSTTQWTQRFNSWNKKLQVSAAPSSAPLPPRPKAVPARGRSARRAGRLAESQGFFGPKISVPKFKSLVLSRM